MGFPQTVVEQALVACGRHCCLCHKFCGTKIELHHIEQRADGGVDSFDNCIPLCFDCHADVNNYNDRHPKGRKYSSMELRQHRNDWYRKVQNNLNSTVSPDHLRLDQELFTKIRALLPSDGVIWFVRNHDYGGSFERKVHQPLFRFLELCELPECEFLDTDMEGLRAKLYETTMQFTQSLGLKTFPLEGNPGWNRIPRDPYEDLTTLSIYSERAKNDEEFDRMIRDQQLRIKVMQEELNQLSTQLVETYDEFIRLGRRRLSI